MVAHIINTERREGLENDDSPRCIMNGRRFVQRGKQWVDAAVEALPRSTPRVRVRVHSREFFEMMMRHPKVLPCVLSARNLQLALGGTIYEVYE